jgi:hypothetical protein
MPLKFLTLGSRIFYIDYDFFKNKLRGCFMRILSDLWAFQIFFLMKNAGRKF